MALYPARAVERALKILTVADASRPSKTLVLIEPALPSAELALLDIVPPAELSDRESAARSFVDRLSPLTFFLDIPLSASHLYPPCSARMCAHVHISQWSGSITSAT